MTRLVRSGRALGLSLLAGALIAASSPAASAPEASKPNVEKRLLANMSKAAETYLLALPGMTEASVAKVMEYRKGGGTFTSIEQFRSVSGIKDEEFSRLKAYYSRPGPERDETTGAPAGKAPVSRVQSRSALAARGKNPPGPPDTPQQGAPSGADAAPGATGGDLGIEARGNYYSILPGYDLTVLSDEERKAFLEAINTEMCPCGCTGETLGFCLVNDPSCMVVKARVRKVYKDITGKEPPAPAAASEK